MIRTLAALVVIAAGITPGIAQKTVPGVEAHLGKGTQLMHEQMFEAAANEFKQALALGPSDPRVHFQYAICLMFMGRNDEARREFEQVRKIAGGSRYLTYYLGRLDFLSNDYASAIKKLSSVAGNPPYPDTAFHLGVAYISSGDVTDGIKWLEKAAKLQPRDYRVHYRLARAYATAGREQDADREFALYSRFRGEHKNTEKEVRACAGALQNQPLAAAREVCHHMYDPNDPEKLTLLGQLFGEAGAFSDALQPLKRAVELDPKSFEAWHDLGLTYFRMKQYKEARAPLEKAVTLRPQFYGSVALLGATLYMLGDDAAALPVLERAHELNPSDTQTGAVLEQLRAKQKKN